MARKPFEDDDPMELVGVGVPEGDVREMAECLVEEFVRMGIGDEELFALFKSPFYTATHRIYREMGEESVKALIGKVRARWGFPRWTVKEVGDA